MKSRNCFPGIGQGGVEKTGRPAPVHSRYLLRGSLSIHSHRHKPTRLLPPPRLLVSPSLSTHQSTLWCRSSEETSVPASFPPKEGHRYHKATNRDGSALRCAVHR